MSALGIDVLDTPAQAGPMTPPGYLAGALRLAFPSTLPREARFVLALDAYLDESGTNPDQAALSVAGYIASPDEWIAFSNEWRKALTDFGIDHFHMTDYANSAGPYKSWSLEQRQERFSRLVEIINRNARASVGMVIQRQLFESCVPPHIQRAYGGLYGLAASSCAMEIARLIRKVSGEAWIAYTFESGAKGAGDIATLFTENERDPLRGETFRILSVRFENKRRFVPLQAADILAYELYRHLPIKLGIDKRPERLFHLEPLSTLPHTWGYLNEEELRKFGLIMSVAWADKKPAKKKQKKRKKRPSPRTGAERAERAGALMLGCGSTPDPDFREISSPRLDVLQQPGDRVA